MSDTFLTRSALLAKTSKPLEGTSTKAMSLEVIATQLQELPGWQLNEGFIERSFGFTDYHNTIAFMNSIALMIHTEDHHPELLVTYNKCKVRFNTHSVNGISINDFICAAKTDALYGR